MRKGLRYAAVAGFGGRLVGAALATARVQYIGLEHYDGLRKAGQNHVFVLWHGRLLPLTYFHRNRDIVTLISASADGEYITRVVRRWGYEVIRGSSSRGGSEALRDLVRAVRSGRSLAITPDGPRGPRETMKPGPLLIARLTGAPLLPVAAAADRCWWFVGWDRFLVPQPFSKVAIAYGEPLHVPRNANEEQMEMLSREIEARIHRATAVADDACAR